MRIHTNDFKNNIKLLGKQLDSIITYTFNNEEIELGNESLNSITPHYEGSILKSVMKQLDIDSNVDIPLNTELNFQFGVKVRDEDVEDYRDNYDYIDFGNYIVFSSEKQEDTNSYKIICYDKMLNAMKPYEKLNITYPITIRDYLSAICNKLGITFASGSDTFANYNRQISNELYLSYNETTHEYSEDMGYTFRDVLDEIAGATASTIVINEDDELEVRYVTETGDTIDEEYLKDINVNFGEQTKAINTIVLSRSGDSDKVYKSYPENLPDDEKVAIQITDNQIMNGNDRSDYLPDILTRLLGFQYYINDFSSTGICYYEVCDRYTIQVGEQYYSCVMFNDEINITQGLEENIHTDLLEESVTDYSKADKTDRRINQTYLIVDKQNQTIESVVSQTIDTSNPDSTTNKVSRLTQRVDELSSEISNVTGMVMTQDSPSGVLVFTDTTTASEIVTMKVHPNSTSISYLYPRSNLYPSSTLYTAIRIVKFHNNTTSEDFDFVLPDDLLYYDSEHYDEFYLDLKSLTCQVTKRCKYNADGSVGLLDSERIDDYSQSGTIYPHLNLTEGIYTVSIPTYASVYLYVTLMCKNIYTDQFYTKVETDTLIDQTAEQITLEANERFTTLEGEIDENTSRIVVNANGISTLSSSKVGNNEVISRINQSPESITINANKLNLQGYVTLTNLNTAGQTQINGGNITTGTINGDNVNVTNINADNITGGTITAGAISLQGTYLSPTSSSLGGWTLSNGGLANGNSALMSNGEISLYPTTGGVYRIADGAVRINADKGIAIVSSSNGSVYAAPGNLDLKACSGYTAYLGCMAYSDGTGELSSVRCKNGVLEFHANSYATWNNATIIWTTSSRATKENIKPLTNKQKNEVYKLLKYIPTISYDYKEQYSGMKNNYGFIIEDIEDTKLKTLLHISQNPDNKDMKYYSTEDLARLELIAIQELMNKVEKLEEKINE